MICHMHQSAEYGFLKVNGKVIHVANLARMVGSTLPEVEGWLKELNDAGVFSCGSDGAIFSKRMLRDEEVRKSRADGGKLGGNPKLLNSKKVADKVNLLANLQPTPSSSSSSSSSLKQNTSDDFEIAWSLYPARSGGNSKSKAFKAWSARIADGTPVEDLMAGVMRYADYIRATDRLNTEYVKQAATFFGPDRHFAEKWTAPAKIVKAPFEGHHSQPITKDFPR
jgi:hypothetical protein